MIEQELLQVLRAFVSDLDAHGSAVATCLELAFERTHEIADFFIINVEIAVPCNAKLIAAVDFKTREQAIDVHPDDRRKEHITVLVGLAQMLGQLDDARERARCLHHATVPAPPERVPAMQAHDEVQALVQNTREGS